MKVTKIIALSAIAAALTLTGNLQAAEKGERGKGKRPEGAQKGQRGGGMAKLLQDIGVSKEKMQAIQKDLRALQDVPREERREKFQAVLKKHLTEDQLKAFEKKRQEMMGARGKGKGKGGEKGGKGKKKGRR